MSIPDLPRYTSWSQVPDGLYTRTQLAEMDPPRKPAKDAPPVGQALYHGNRYAPLWPLDATVAKRRPSEAQRVALLRAAAARHICKRCDARTHPSATPDSPPDAGVDPWVGRLCDRCTHVLRAHSQHCDYRKRAQRVMSVLAGRGAIAVQADDVHEPRRLALVEFADMGRLEAGQGRVLVDAALAVPGTDPAGWEISYRDAIGLVDGLMREREQERLPVFVGWRYALTPIVMVANHDLDRAGQERRWDEDSQAGRIGHERWSAWDAVKPYAWMDQKWEEWREVGNEGTMHRVGVLRSVDVLTEWHYYHAEPSSEGDDPRYYHPTFPERHPRATGDVVVDAHLVMQSFAGIADGTELVSGRAPWLVFPPTVPGYDGP